jgi:CHASE2 domain-containing sensor protein
MAFLSRVAFVFYWRVRVYMAVKGLRYWLTAALVLAATVVFTPMLDDDVDLSGMKYRLYQILTDLDPNPARPRDTMIVFIEDDVHSGLLGDRKPLRRDYLQKIVAALDAADVQLIALDFLLPSLDPHGKAAPGDFRALGEYRAETDGLMREIARVASPSRKIVLPQYIFVDEKKGLIGARAQYIQQLYGICTEPLPNGRWKNTGAPGFPLNAGARANISCGYLNLPSDMRQMPPPVSAGSFAIDSFSLAIVRALIPEKDARAIAAGKQFVSYFPQTTVQGETVISSSQLLGGDPATLRLLAHKVVIVGGHWLDSRGSITDTHPAPDGELSGPIIHQNFVEATLEGRLYSPLESDAVEIVLAVAAALIFAVSSSVWTKIGLLGSGLLALFAVQWVAFFGLHIFVDAFLPVVGLGLHSIIERLAEPRHEHHGFSSRAERYRERTEALKRGEHHEIA